jgi:hypothetical protein
VDTASPVQGPIQYVQHEQEHVLDANLSVAICYQHRYVEPNNHKQGQKWSERQIGVYHELSIDPAVADVLILLHAMPESGLHRRIVESCGNQPGLCYGKQKAATGLYLHVLIISTYINNWRWFLDDIGTSCANFVGTLSKKFLETHR